MGIKLLPNSGNLFVYGSFFMLLNSISNLCYSFLQIENGYNTQYLQSFPIWLLATFGITLLGLITLFQYFLYKKYFVPLIFTVLFGFAILYGTSVLFVMRTAYRAYGHYNLAYGLVVIVGLLIGTSLLVSRSRSRVYLKVAGFSIAVFFLVSTILFFWGLSTKDFGLNIQLANIRERWAFLGSLLPIPFFLNFLEEVRLFRGANSNLYLTAKKKVVLGIAALLIVLTTVSLTLDSFNNTLRTRKPSKLAQKLAAPFEARIYTNSRGETLPYRLLMPKNYDPKLKYPIAICLHHGGGNGIDNVVHVETASMALELSKEINQDKYPAFLFVPQCPPGSSFGGIPTYSKIDDLVFEAMEDLEKKFSIDPRRRYIMGISLGGFGTWHSIGKRPDLFAAAIPICGGGEPSKARNMVNIPIWAFHGEKDTNVPVQLSRDMIDSIRKAGGNPKYIEFKDQGHDIWKAVDEIPGKWEWLFAQQRQ